MDTLMALIEQNESKLVSLMSVREDLVDNDNKNNDDNVSDKSGHSDNEEFNKPEASPIVITKSYTADTPDIPESTNKLNSIEYDDDDKENDNNNVEVPDSLERMDSLGDPSKSPRSMKRESSPRSNKSSSPKKKRKSNPNVGRKRKKLIAAEMLGKLKNRTHYTKFETPLYILPLNVAEAKKCKDEKYMIKQMRIQMGYKVELKQKGMLLLSILYDDIHKKYIIF